jgi:hypothetical protein
MDLTSGQESLGSGHSRVSLPCVPAVRGAQVLYLYDVRPASLKNWKAPWNRWFCVETGTLEQGHASYMAILIILATPN